MKIGILGAGFIGRAVARLAVLAGYDVMISNSRGPQSLGSTMISVGCKVGSAAQASEFGDLILVAIPFNAIKSIDPAPLAGKIVMDANNYYPQRDGAISELDSASTTTSEMLAIHLKGARVVKAWNAILEKDIEADARPAGVSRRRALPIAGDDARAKLAVIQFLDRVGFDTVDAGPLSQGWRFERARPAYCVPLDIAGLKAALAIADTSAQAEGAWRHAGASSATTGDVTLYGYWRSSATYRTRIALNFKGISYKTVGVHLLKDEQTLPAHLARHPSGRVPILEIDGHRIGQSMAMIDYLDETRPEPSLLPRDPAARALVRDLKDQIVADIHPLNNTSTLARLRSQFGADDAAIAAWYEHWIVRGFRVLEQMLPSTGNFCVGNAATLADIALVPQVTNARRYPQIDLKQFPNILRIDTALRQIKAFHDAAPDQQLEAREV